MSEIESKIASEICDTCKNHGWCWFASVPHPEINCTVLQKVEALIAADRAGLVEALERIKVDTTLDYYEIREIAQEALAEIDSALKEMGK
jgi:hypothetical protein